MSTCPIPEDPKETGPLAHPKTRDLSTEMIPPRQDIAEHLAWLQWLVWEALGLCWVMQSSKRYTTSEIIAAHLFAQGIAVPVQMLEHAAPVIERAL